MMKKYRIILASVFLLAMIGVFVACGTPQTQQNTNPSTQNQQNKPSTQTQQNLNEIGNDVENMGNDALEGIKDTGDAIMDGVENAKDSIMEGIDDAGNSMKDTESTDSNVNSATSGRLRRNR